MTGLYNNLISGEFSNTLCVIKPKNKKVYDKMSYRPLSMGPRKHVDSVLGSGTIKCRYYLFCQKVYAKRKS